MIKRHPSRLLCAALTSTLFIAPLITSVAQADTTIDTQVTTPQDTTNGPITITSIGQVYVGSASGNGVNMSNGTPNQNILTINPNNANGVQAVYVYDQNSVAKAVNFTTTGTLNIDAGSGISTFLDFPGDHTVYVGNGATATVNNAGIIQALNGSNARLNIYADSGATLILQNESTGLITGSIPVYLASGSLNSKIINDGTIQNNSNSQSSAAIYIAGPMAKFINTGLIESKGTANSDATIVVAGGAIIGGLNNSGNIVNYKNDGLAIDLSAVGTEVTLNQLPGGTITGNVLLAPAGYAQSANNIALNMTGGIITGDVTATQSTTGTVLNLYDGTITGAVTLTEATTMAGDTLNLHGGSFGILKGSNSQFTSLNIYSTLIANGNIIGIGNIAVEDGGTFIVAQSLSTNHEVFNMSGGTLEIGPATQISTGVYTNSNGSVLVPVIGSSSFSSLGDVALIAAQGVGGAELNGEIAPQLVAGDFFANNAQFYIVSAPNGFSYITDNSTLVSPNLVMLNLVKEPPLNPNTQYVLTLTRNSYQAILPPAVNGVAVVLDGLAAGNGPTDPTLRAMLGGLDTSTTMAQLESYVETLLPPNNWSMPQTLTFAMNSIFSTIRSQMEERGVYAIAANQRVKTQQVAQNNSGVSSGDTFENHSVWGKVLGSYLDQSTRRGINGYRANSIGFAIGSDWHISDCAILGLAGSYTKINVDGKGYASRDQAIQDYQGTLYGWYTPADKFFIDAMMAIAGQHYNNNRVIDVGTFVTVAQSNFNGWQFGAQGDVGYVFIDNDAYFAAPIIQLRYNYLSLNSYNETNVGGMGLSVPQQNFTEFAGGVGVQLAMQGISYDNITYVPELTALVLYDFTVDAQNTTSNFLGGGASFATNGITPGRTIFDLNLGFNVQFAPHSIFTIEYDLELRSDFVGNAGYLQYYYYWK